MAINQVLGTAIDLIKLIAGKPSPVGLPFPFPPHANDAPKIASGFTETNLQPLQEQQDVFGTPVVKITDEHLGRYEFMPVYINDGIDGDYLLPNALIMIQGQKGIIETDVIDRGAVFEKVFERPYDISILVQIFDNEHKWPAEQFKAMAELYRGDRLKENRKEIVSGRDLVTLKCALTNPFLQPENNFLITKFQLLDNGGAENMEVIQIDGRSNIDFELIIK